MPDATSGGTKETAIATPVTTVATFGFTMPYAAISPDTTATINAVMRWPVKFIYLSGATSGTTKVESAARSSVTKEATHNSDAALMVVRQLRATMPKPSSKIG